MKDVLKVNFLIWKYIWPLERKLKSSHSLGVLYILRDGTGRLAKKKISRRKMTGNDMIEKRDVYGGCKD